MVLRALARPLMASAFLTRGVESWQHPGSRIPTAERVVDALPLTARGNSAAALVRDPEVLVRANGAVMAGAAALFGCYKLGCFNRSASQPGNAAQSGSQFR